jgi:hypothetical protein
VAGFFAERVAIYSPPLAGRRLVQHRRKRLNSALGKRNTDGRAELLPLPGTPSHEIRPVPTKRIRSPRSIDLGTSAAARSRVSELGSLHSSIPANPCGHFLHHVFLPPSSRSGLALGLATIRYLAKRSRRQVEQFSQLSVAYFPLPRRTLPDLLVWRMTSFTRPQTGSGKLGSGWPLGAASRFS